MTEIANARTSKRLATCALTRSPEEAHERTCGYWYKSAGPARFSLAEEPKFERIYDETNSYLAALIALRPQLTEAS